MAADAIQATFTNRQRFHAGYSGMRTWDQKIRAAAIFCVDPWSCEPTSRGSHEGSSKWSIVRVVSLLRKAHKTLTLLTH